MTPTNMKLKIRKGATVQVIAGAEKGKKGTVMDVNPGKMVVRVQGIRVQTHFDKKEGLLKKEGYIHYSNLKLVDAPASHNKTASKAKSKAKKA
ncbi:MAG: KOW motif-containing protein [Bdellovibrionales bacterium]